MTLKQVLVVFSVMVAVSSAFGWSEPHLAITKAALEVLPVWQKQILGNELPQLGNHYCLIPDEVFTDKKNAKFAAMDTHPGEVYLKFLHLPLQQPENFETLRYFIEKAVQALQERNTGDAARFMGTICHLIEDYGSPAHTIPGDNMFTLLQQFLPPPEHMKNKLLHSPIESGELEVVIPDYKPRLLGVSINEAAWHLLHRIHEVILNARSTTLPIIHGLYAQDHQAVATAQMKAATMDAKVVADALHTILCLGAHQFDEEQQQSLRSVSIGGFFPLEAQNLFFPQSTFFGSPYWGHARSGIVLENGTRELPLKLAVSENNSVVEKEFTDGIGTGVRSSLTYLVPGDVYRKFSVRVGLHPQLGASGRVEFIVSCEGKKLATATIEGSQPSEILECELTGIRSLELVATSKGSNPKSNYAIWAEPKFIK